LRFEHISIPSWLLAFSRRIRFSRNKTFRRQLCREVVIKAELEARSSPPGRDCHSKGNGQVNKSRRSPRTFVFVLTMLITFSSPSPAQVRVLISGGFSAPYQELLPQFEKSTGITVTTARGASGGSGPNGPALSFTVVSPPTW
jgi:hypothetical protein